MSKTRFHPIVDILCLYDILFNMKTIATRLLHHQLSKVLSWVEEGQEVEITRRNKRIAKIIPMANEDLISKEKIQARWRVTMEGRQLEASRMETWCSERHRNL